MATLNLVQARSEVDEVREVAPAAVGKPETAGESLAERGLTAAAMGGAALGAAAGAVLGAPLDGTLPTACGALGTMLGSGFVAGAWCLLADLWSGR